MKNEKTTQYNKRNYTHRVMSIAISICLACICIIHPTIAYAIGTDYDVEIVSTNDHGYYEVYDSNGNIVNSFVQGTSSGFFVKSWNALAKNIARITSTVYNTNQVNSSINNLLNSTNSLVNTVNANLGYINSHVSLIQDQMSSYFGANSSSYPNNIYGKLDYIQTYTFQTVQRLDQIKTLLNNDNTINWTKIKDVQSIVDSNNNTISGNTTVSNGYVDFNFGNIDIIGNNVYSIILPISSNNLYSRNNYIDKIKILYNTNGGDLAPLNTAYTYSHYSTYININFSNLGVIGSYNLIIRVYLKYPAYVKGAETCSISYINANNIDYYTVSYLDVLRNINDKQSEIISTVKSNAFDDQDIIDAINNLSLVDNDVKIEVNYTHNDALDVTGAIQYITSFFKGNGVTLGDFTTQSNTSQSQWLSQTNQDLLGTATGGYVNLYE